MKKLFIMIFPMIVVIAVAFYFTGRNYNFNSMLNVFSQWEFENTIEAFVRVRDTFESVGNAWESIRLSNNVWDTLTHLIDLNISLITGLGRIVISLGYVLVDFVDNVILIVDYLFGYTFIGT